MTRFSRRGFLISSLALAGHAAWGSRLFAQAPVLNPNELPARPEGVEILFPRNRVPLSFIIDDSTCLVNMGHFCMPQFAEAWPDRDVYKKPWRSFPREIPDGFVREFGEWCGEHGVKGKYSIVPYPACVGRLDRELPGWSRRDLQDSLRLVRDLMLPNWDIHPEMITHTRVIDLHTGHPHPEIHPGTMENSYPQVKKSVDELAAYIAYALRIVKNCDLPCEGFTTPGGFGNLVKSELSLAAREALADVYRPEIPHYFKYVIGGEGSTEPRLEHVTGLGTKDLQFTVNVPAGTGDWFGSWEGDAVSEPDRYANVDATSGRMVELIERNQPAIMLCHWPGMYCNGTRTGFAAFQRVVTSLESRFRDRTMWMKLSEIARYWAARSFTTVKRTGTGLEFEAPFACPAFTVGVAAGIKADPTLHGPDGRVDTFTSAPHRPDLDSGKIHRQEHRSLFCFNLAQGTSRIEFG